MFSLPLSTKEGFVLSRVDGVASVEDISIMVGIKAQELLSVLDRLADLGAVQLSWRPAKVSGRPAVVAAAAAAASAPPKGDPMATALRVFGEVSYDEAELRASAELSLETKRLILNAFYSIEGRHYYQVLGLTRSADKKAIRASYFEMSRLFHPDTYFGKELGPFKAQMVAVFKRLTEAYETLSRAARRNEYDAYLTETIGPAEPDELPQQDEKVVQPRQSAVPPPPSEPVIPLPETQPRSAFASGGPPRQEVRAPAPARAPLSIEDRRAQVRERLRRNLPGGTAPRSQPPPAASPRPSSQAPAPASSPSVRQDGAMQGLRQSLRQSSTSAGGAAPVLAHLRKAKDAEQAGDLLTAASSLQAALALAPNQRDLQVQYDRVSKLLTRSLADNYEKQARYEEKQGQWAKAAASWERVLEGRPEDAAAARSAAEALLRCNGDLHKAQRFAQQAVDAAPSTVANVVVLARVHLAAGLKLNARRELEKAVKLDPQNEMIKSLLREAR